MTCLGSADYDTWQIYFPPCLEKILKKTICLSAVSETLNIVWCLTTPTKHQRRSVKSTIIGAGDLKLTKFTNSCCTENMPAQLLETLVRISWRTLRFSRWWRPGTRWQSWTTERWNTSVEEDTVTWSCKRSTQLTICNSWTTTTRSSSVYYSPQCLTNLLLDESSLKSFSHLSSGSLKGSTSSPDSPDTLSLSRCCSEKKSRVWQKKTDFSESMKLFHWSGSISYLIQFSHLLQGALKLLQRPHSRQTLLCVVQTNLHFWLLAQQNVKRYVST